MTSQLAVLNDAQAMLAQGHTPVSAMDFYFFPPDGGLAEEAWLVGEE